jgi:exodeoxyribonuclease V alpha subunit
VFRRDAENPLDLDLVVVDEVSMIDVELMARLLEALPDRARLILVGDTDQLPAVGAGDVLADLIASRRVPCTALTEIKRQDEGLIIRNCHHIRRGEDIEVDNTRARDFFFVERASEREIIGELLELVAERLPTRFRVDPLRDVQVLVPRRSGTELSCQALNVALQDRLNPGRREDRSRFALGDKVIQTRNNYELEVFNGDLGVVQGIQGRSMLVRFDNPSRVVDLDLHRNDLELGYAVTVHKFQGSEARVVVIPVHSSAGAMLLQRSWLYTAISRAREVCVLVGQRREVRRAIQRDAPQRRFTLLEQLLDADSL